MAYNYEILHFMFDALFSLRKHKSLLILNLESCFRVFNKNAKNEEKHLSI